MESRHKYKFCTLLFTLFLISVAMTVQADDWTSTSGVTTTPDPVGIGLTGPLAAKLHVVSASNNSIMQLYGPSAATNGVAQGVLFTDTMATEGYCCGVVMNLMGNSIIRISNLQIGQWGNALLQSTNGAPLILNGSGVTGSPAGDVVVGYEFQPIGLRVLSSGNSSFHGPVGIGTTSPAAGVKFQVEDLDSNVNMLVSAGDNPSAPHSPTVSLMRKDANDAQVAKYGLTLDGSDGNKFKLLYGGTAGFTTTPLVVDTAGNVGIGTNNPGTLLDVAGGGHFLGDVTVGGIINAKYQDVAEWVPSEGAMPAGTVVILNPLKTNAVTPSTKAYDTSVAGVVSDQPGVLLGVGGENKAKIATTGRVKVRVDARAHAVHIGDLLVTSDIPGTAMLSQPLDLSGVKIHRPGTLIGKALEPLAGGEGEILVLLSLQ